MKKHPVKTLLRRLLLALLGLALGCNAYLANAQGVAGNRLPMPFGVGVATVLSGSMQPALAVGDLLFVTPAKTVQPGDIVVYQTQSSLIVHRVLSVQGDTVVTQGDANNTPDDPIHTAQIKGVVRFRIPRVGAALQLLKTPAGTLAVLALAVALVELSFRSEKAADDCTREQLKAEIRRLQQENGEQENK